MNVNIEGVTNNSSSSDNDENVKLERQLPVIPNQGVEIDLEEVTKGVIEKIAPKEPVVSKSVTFLLDIESKAIVESLGDLEDFSVSKLMTIVPKLMKHVENYKNLKGSQKRDLVIKMLRHIIDITDGPGNDAVWDPILKDLVPGLIDTLIEVNDGKLKLRKKPLKFLKVFCCMSRPKVDA